MILQNYIQELTKRFNLGNATEHTFRGDLQQLIESIVPEVQATNEPKRQSCGAPDYILTKKDIPLGFIEAKVLAIKTWKKKRKRGTKNNLIDYLN